MATLWLPLLLCHSALLPCHCLLSATAAALPPPPCCSATAVHCCPASLPTLHYCPATAALALLPCHCCSLPLLLLCTPAWPLRPTALSSATVPLISIVAASRRTVANRKSAANCSIMHKQQSLQRLGERLSLYGIIYGEDCSLFGVSSKSAYYFYCCCCCCYCSTSASSKDCNIIESLLRFFESLLNHCWLRFDALLKQTKFFFAPF